MKSIALPFQNQNASKSKISKDALKTVDNPPKEKADEKILKLSKTPPRISKPKSSETTPVSKTTKNGGDGSAKRGSGNYWAYRNREGPKNLGSKELPKVLSCCNL